MIKTSLATGGAGHAASAVNMVFPADHVPVTPVASVVSAANTVLSVFHTPVTPWMTPDMKPTSRSALACVGYPLLEISAAKAWVISVGYAAVTVLNVSTEDDSAMTEASYVVVGSWLRLNLTMSPDLIPALSQLPVLRVMQQAWVIFLLPITTDPELGSTRASARVKT